MSGTLVFLLLGGLAAIAVVIAAVTMRRSGPRPDAPLKGMETDHGPGRADDTESAEKVDRPGGPGQEPERPETGSAAPGSPADDASD
ncbi:MAG: hypothetical protein KY460_01045 [Actinobacteria bacterium]|nr:hypothetical protein [Actinomycetota bacterium]